MSVSTPAPSTSSEAPVQPAPAASTTHEVHRDAVIDMRQVTRTFGSVRAVSKLSLAVPPGAILGLIGPSGSGKTTTIRMITGALRPDSGRMRVLGEEPRRFRRLTRERIGYMPQALVLYPDLTPRENVDFVAALFGLLIFRRRRRVEEVLRLVELWDARDRRVANLSGGQQRRVALACALVHEPELLILDEPTAGIDPLLRQQVWAELRRLRDNGVTLLVTTQYVSEAEYCDWVALISLGELVAYDTPTEVRRQALGGEVVQVSTTQAFDARQLPVLPGVAQIRQEGPRELLVVATDAGQAVPAVVDAINEAGGDVEWTREYRPTFDEVFAELVTRHAGQPPETAGGGISLPSLRFPLERR